jgi:glucosamine--fructose-6-phosphate aminotransferase (isomerizing)
MTPDVMAIASEMYGLVELTPCYVKAEGERIDGGEVFHLQSERGEPRVETVDDGGSAALPVDRRRTAEITTRDINRGDKPHFFLKEIFESVDSVWKTFRGKFDTTGGTVRFLPGKEVLGEELVKGLRTGKIRRVFCIGQGTAAVAAGGIAHLLERALVGADHAVQVAGLKATELSGHWLSDDMSDTLVVAVSQSGTTTDTNRTVDMARERGARIVGIVNRRNSDLVYKSHGVLYTSDGRDIEMSVASTKAFYSQNVAGQVLSLALACELGTLEPGEILSSLRELERLPDAMRRALELDEEVARAADRFAVRRRHWAVVGSGAGNIAADEIRIKLSELCYKSIAVDFLEDKKHIDLSSEPFVLVCASGVPPSTISDLVKEVAIFKAHKSLPVVITDEGESRFDPYAAETLRVPRDAGRLAYLLTTVVGHLLGYHAAAALDRAADRLRRIRAEFLALCEAYEEPLRAARDSAELSKLVREAQEMLLCGGVDAGMGAAVTTRLYRTLEVLSGRLPQEVLDAAPPEGVIKGLTGAITELSRPIDAIKHQAKTVTVGISRGEPPAGALPPDGSGSGRASVRQA